VYDFKHNTNGRFVEALAAFSRSGAAHLQVARRPQIQPLQREPRKVRPAERDCWCGRHVGELDLRPRIDVRKAAHVVDEFVQRAVRLESPPSLATTNVEAKKKGARYPPRPTLAPRVCTLAKKRRRSAASCSSRACAFALEGTLSALFPP